MNFLDMKKLETERLVLRRLEKRDAYDMYEYAKDPEASRFLTWNPHPNLSYTKAYVKFLIKKYRTCEYFDWAVVEKSSGKFIGTCGFSVFSPENRKAEIGYVLNPDFHGFGYGIEAVRKVIDYAFSELLLHRIEARCIEENKSSIKLLEKCGFILEGIGKDELFLKDEFKTIHHFAKINPDNSL
jgi:ribosomal-protein-alanine N-acetyltransferase